MSPETRSELLAAADELERTGALTVTNAGPAVLAVITPLAGKATTEEAAAALRVAATPESESHPVVVAMLGLAAELEDVAADYRHVPSGTHDAGARNAHMAIAARLRAVVSRVLAAQPDRAEVVERMARAMAEAVVSFEGRWDEMAEPTRGYYRRLAAAAVAAVDRGEGR